MNSDTITSFLWEGEITVRIIEREGTPWFVALDICNILGIENARDALGTLDDDEKGICTSENLGDRQKTVLISEIGLYTIVFLSKKSDARKFYRWVTGEVLPTLRRAAEYITSTTIPAVIVRGPHSKSFEQWTLEERRVALTHVNTARHTRGPAAAVWTWWYLGLPIPPRHLLPAWWQSDMVLNGESTATASGAG